MCSGWRLGHCNAPVEQRLRGNIKIAGPTNGVVGHIGLAKQGSITQSRKNASIKVGLYLKKLDVTRAKDDLEPVIWQGFNGGNCFHGDAFALGHFYLC